MPTRVGIEISPAACRIVEIEAGPMWRRPEADTRVRSFARLPLTSPQMRAKLATLRGRKAAVVAWGLPSDHRHFTVTNGPTDRMRREAMAALRTAGVATRGMMGDVAPVAPEGAGTERRPVVIAIAAAHEVSSAVQALLDAGLHVQSVVTPPLALTSLARMRRAFTVPDTTEAYVALEESMTSFALVRNGALVAARDLEWGYLGDAAGGPQPRPREEIAARLADELRGFFDAAALSETSETQICICGSLPELRSMTVPLMERLDLEVETLDSLFTIDAARLPEPTDQFLEQSAELRLAWAVAADWPQPLNLLRERQRRQRRTTFAMTAVAAGVAAGIGVGWRIDQSAWWQSTAFKPVARAAMPGSPPSTARRVAAAPRSAPAKQAPQAVVATARPLPPAVQPFVKLPAVNAPPPTVERKTAPPVVARAASNPSPVTRPSPAPRQGQPKPDRAPLPFDAVLGTILYSPDRKLAIVDGRIVQPDDDVRGARIVDITPTAVLLRDAGGRLRRLSLGSPGR